MIRENLRNLLPSSLLTMSNTIDIEWKQKLAEQIKQARESADLTQDELADLIGVSRQMVVNYEKKKGVPVIDVLARIAVELETRFKIKDLIITVEQTSTRLRSVPKQLRLDFEKSQTFGGAVISITPKEGQILISAKIPA
jgi:transcriptional regulator with XRE-family HTH domain